MPIRSKCCPTQPFQDLTSLHSWKLPSLFYDLQLLPLPPSPLSWDRPFRGPQQQRPSFFFSDILKSFLFQDLCTYRPSPWITVPLTACGLISNAVTSSEGLLTFNIATFYFPHSCSPFSLSFLPCSAHCVNLANSYSCLFSALSPLAINSTKAGTLSVPPWDPQVPGILCGA